MSVRSNTNRRTRRIRFLAPVVAVVLTLALTGVVLAQVTFTGEVTTDFTTGFDRIIPDSLFDVGQAPSCAPPYENFSPGWNVEQAAFHYNCTTDILYVGIDYPAGTIGGDAEGDGDPSNTHACLVAAAGTDLPTLGGSESIALGLDLNQDGSYDWIAGVDGTSGCANARVAQYTCGSNWAGCPPSGGFGAAPTLGAVMGLSGCPAAGWPDFEFSITNFSTLFTESGFPPPACSGIDPHYDWRFDFAVFSGSASDDGVGEDFMYGTVGFGPNAVTLSDLDARSAYRWAAVAVGVVSLVGVGGALLLLRRRRVL